MARVPMTVATSFMDLSVPHTRPAEKAMMSAADVVSAQMNEMGVKENLQEVGREVR